MPETVTEVEGNVRPSTAASWATDLAGPRASRRASSDAWRVPGISRSVRGEARSQRSSPAYQQARLEHGPADLLDVERVPAGRGDDPVDDLLGKGQPAAEGGSQFPDDVVAQRAERQRGDRLRRHPRRLELGTGREQDQDRYPGHPRQQPVEGVEGGGVAPVEVLDAQHQGRRRLRASTQPTRRRWFVLDGDRRRARPPASRGCRAARRPARHRGGRRRRPGRTRPAAGPSARSDAASARSSSSSSTSSTTGRSTDIRVSRAPALSSHSGPSARDDVGRRCATSRDLPTPGSPGHQDPATTPGSGPGPGVLQCGQLAADRPTSGPRRPTAGRFRPRSSRRASTRKAATCRGIAAEPHRPERRGVEAVVRQAHDRTAGQHGARLGEGLQAGGDVEGLAHGHGGAPVGSAELADDGGSAVHADPDRESPGGVGPPTAPTMSSAAVKAWTASSSWAWGQPNRNRMPSPLYPSTSPPSRRTMVTACCW